MFPALVRKTWRDDRRALIGWATGVALFTVIYTSFYSQFQGAAELKQAALPQGMLDFLGIADMLSPAGYLQATIFSLTGPLLVLMCAITLTARTIARPEEDGSMELLLANPLSRVAFAAQRLAATGSAITVVAAIPLILLMIVVPRVGMAISLSHVAAAGVGLIALVWCFTGITFLAGAASGARGTVMAVTGVLAVTTYLANAIGGMSDGWQWLRWLSPFHYFIGTDPLRTGWHPAQLLTLVAVGAVTAAIGVFLFDRRDVGV
ncbi:ABC transporter permease component [Micromonospora sp. ATCC 39149]|uniref:ABC transporter permease subunit n=1 Tax=Micromonospora carbonacea TaxID=47853 RepID=A0A7D5Y7R5_9ACTN|nr:ABC transporter permease subunit [Micromonospora sp. ATCC 39149]EEP70347.1 ABC transporter permease component [Micromonospora sp. ATCC 39149]QLJ96760.1 ABC transporter permease subunit [Micromonospora carbonacea]